MPLRPGRRHGPPGSVLARLFQSPLLPPLLLAGLLAAPPAAEAQFTFTSSTTVEAGESPDDGDFGNGVAVDASGNIYVVGQVGQGSNSNRKPKGWTTAWTGM